MIGFCALTTINQGNRAIKYFIVIHRYMYTVQSNVSRIAHKLRLLPTCVTLGH